jgi:hypothetical protein
MNRLLTPLVALQRSRTSLSAVGAPSRRSPSSRQRRWLQVAEEPGFGRSEDLPTPAIECDPRARPRIQGTPQRCPEVALVARVERVESPLLEEAPAGLLRNQGPYRLLGPIRRRAFTIARGRSGVSPICSTRTPRVAGSWEGPGGEPGAPDERRPQRARPGCPARVRP